MKRRKAKTIRLQRATRGVVPGPGRPRLLKIDVEMIDGVVIDSAMGSTMVLMMDGSRDYVVETPHEVLEACEALGCPIGVFTRQGAKEAMNDCLE
jgi:hypothetical protein